jgi:hypothetical protein
MLLWGWNRAPMRPPWSRLTSASSRNIIRTVLGAIPAERLSLTGRIAN